MLEGLICVIIGALFFYAYINNIGQLKEDKNEERRIPIKTKDIWLSVAMGLFIASFFINQNLNTITVSGSTTTFNYQTNNPLQFVGQAFTLTLITTVIVIAIARTSRVVLRLRF